MSIKPGAILCFLISIVFVVPFLASLGWSAIAILAALLILVAGIYVASREVDELRLHFAQLREAAIRLDPQLSSRPDGSVPLTFMPLLLLFGVLVINAFVALVVGPVWWVICLVANMALGVFGVVFTFYQLEHLRVKDRLKLLYLRFRCAGAAFGGLPLLLSLEGAPSWLISSLVACCYAFLASVILLRILIWVNLPWQWRFIRMLYLVSMHHDAPLSPCAPEPPVEEADSLSPGTPVALSLELHIVAPAQSLRQQEPAEEPLPLYYQRGYQSTAASHPLAEGGFACPEQEGSQEAYEWPQAAYPMQQQPPM